MFIHCFVSTFEHIINSLINLRIVSWEADSCGNIFSIVNIDGFVFDLKCFPACQKVITGAEDYWETVIPAILQAYQTFDGPFIVRHLIMPGHTLCCTKPIVEWCRQNIPKACFNLMTGFEDFRLDVSGPREITQHEKENARQWLMDAHFENCLLDGNLIGESSD